MDTQEFDAAYELERKCRTEITRLETEIVSIASIVADPSSQDAMMQQLVATVQSHKKAWDAYLDAMDVTVRLWKRAEAERQQRDSLAKMSVQGEA